MDWFLYDNGPRHERVKCTLNNFSLKYVTTCNRATQHGSESNVHMIIVTEL